MKRLACVLAFLLTLGGPIQAAEHPLLLASTTSTENSGLFAYLLPLFEAATGIRTRVIAVGTGQALRLGRNGDADILLVHDAAAEKAFVAQGHGSERRAIMYNDFVLLGPAGDPAGIRGLTDIRAALRAIAASRALFVSRGDDSGTHRAERRHWKDAGIDVAAASGLVDFDPPGPKLGRGEEHVLRPRPAAERDHRRVLEQQERVGNPARPTLAHQRPLELRAVGVRESS